MMVLGLSNNGKSPVVSTHILKACIFYFKCKLILVLNLQLDVNPLGIKIIPGQSKLKLAYAIGNRIYEQDGFRGFYRGYFASLAAYVPNSALWWVFYHMYQGNDLK